LKPIPAKATFNLRWSRVATVHIDEFKGFYLDIWEKPRSMTVTNQLIVLDPKLGNRDASPDKQGLTVVDLSNMF
jgi:hypothetical protein